MTSTRKTKKNNPQAKDKTPKPYNVIDRVTIDKIMDAARIEDVVSDFVNLKRAGANLKGLCPFHDDRTPSFMVSPAKNLCKCFACGKGGSPVGFIMEHEQLSYPDALRYLARKYGIPIEEKELSPEETQSRNDKDSMFIVNEWAKEWFEKQLHESVPGQAVGMMYFRSRGFRDDIIKKFQLGFCPDAIQYNLGKDALKAGYQEKYLINTIDQKEPRNSIGTGLCIKNEKGDLKDRFRGRVIWPIFTISGKVAGFGGRVLDAATKGVNVKYLNSPESLVYSKRKELFGLYHAKEAIRKQDLCYLVEGYTDVMAMHQSGVENVVASSGTALTTDQIRLIHRMTNNITVIFDGDEAGIHASERGIDMLLAEGMNVRLLLLPDGDDPDSFSRKHNAMEFQDYLQGHNVDFIHFKTQLLLESSQGDPAKLSKLIHNIVESIAVIPNEITRVLYIQQAAQTLKMEERLLQTAVNKQMQKLREEQRKTQEREERRQAIEKGIDIVGAGFDTPPPPSSEAEPEETNILPASPSPYLKLEEDIVHIIINYGEQPFCNVEDAEGNEITLSVLEYIYYTLHDDDITLQGNGYELLLTEALAHVKDPGFKASNFFLNHSNRALADLALSFLGYKETISKCFSIKPEGLDNKGEEEEKETEKDAEKITEEENINLYEVVPQLTDSLKVCILKKEVDAILEEIKKPEVRADKARTTELLKKYAEKDKYIKELAKERRIVILK